MGWFYIIGKVAFSRTIDAVACGNAEDNKWRELRCRYFLFHCELENTDHQVQVELPILLF